MEEKHFLDKVTSWIQDHPSLMLLAGVGTLISLFNGFTGYQPVACLVSGIINLTGYVLYSCYASV